LVHSYLTQLSLAIPMSGGTTSNSNKFPVFNWQTHWHDIDITRY